MEELMPAVNPADLAPVFNFYRDLQSQYGGVGVAYSVPPERLEALCSPGADIETISTRAVFLHLLLTFPPQYLSAWINDGAPDSRLFEVAAKFPFPVMRHTDPRPHDFDLEGFIQQLNGV